MLALGTEAQPINKSIKITQHNMNTLCRYVRFPQSSHDDRFHLGEGLYLKNKITPEKRTKLLIIDR
jgi:hypothetical protein